MAGSGDPTRHSPCLFFQLIITRIAAITVVQGIINGPILLSKTCCCVPFLIKLSRVMQRAIKQTLPATVNYQAGSGRGWKGADAGLACQHQPQPRMSFARTGSCSRKPPHHQEKAWGVHR